MPIQDSNAERRNLTVASVSFLAYFWGGGNVQGGVLKLPVISLEFQHISVLAVMAWSALFWFAFRYWLGNSGQFLQDFRKESVGWIVDPTFRDYIASKSEQSMAKTPREVGWHVAKLSWSRRYLKAHIIYAQNISRDALNQISSKSGPANAPKSMDVVFDDLKGFSLVARAAIRCFITKPSFSSYVVPYILFLLAVTSGMVALVL